MKKSNRKNNEKRNYLLTALGIIAVCFLIWLIAAKNLEPFTELYFDNETSTLLKQTPCNRTLFDNPKNISFVISNFENKEMQYTCVLSIEKFKDNSSDKEIIAEKTFSLKDKKNKTFVQKINLPKNCKDYDYIKVIANLIKNESCESQEIYFWIHNERYHNIFRERKISIEYNFSEDYENFYINKSLPKQIHLNKDLPIQFVIKANEKGKYSYEILKTIYFMNNSIVDRLTYETLILKENDKKIVNSNFTLEQSNYPIKIEIQLTYGNIQKKIDFMLNPTSQFEEKIKIINFSLSKKKMKIAEWFSIEIEKEILMKGNYKTKIIFIDINGTELSFKQGDCSEENRENKKIKETCSWRSYADAQSGKYDVFLAFFDEEKGIQLENLLENERIYLGEIILEPENGK